jgi:hypothetical protein
MKRPFEPRGTDYALVGSFYVCNLDWFGVYALWYSRIPSPKIAGPVIAAGLLAAPVLMGYLG